VESAIAGVSGCMGQNEDREGTPIRAIEFERVKGGKHFDKDVEWFQELLKEIGQVRDLLLSIFCTFEREKERERVF